MTASKLSPAKDVMAKQRERKLAAALRTNLRRRKDQARDRADTETADSVDAATSVPPTRSTEPQG